MFLNKAHLVSKRLLQSDKQIRIIMNQGPAAETQGEVHCVDVNAPNPGNPVFSCDKRTTTGVSGLVTSPRTHEPLSKAQHPMYITSSNSYGALQLTVEMTPNSFHGRSQKFSEHLGQSGMYRNHSLNTSKDHSQV